MNTFHELGVREAAQAIRAGDLTAEALAETLLARCSAAAQLNAFISLAPDRVRAAARRADQQRQRGDRLGPLHGVPLVLKDNIDTVDFLTTAGTPGLAAHRPKRNAPIVQLLLDAGALVLGKANLQELAYGPTSNNAAFGPVRNPYDPTRIPGGSSGGTAAAVAARLAPAGLGTDTAGSVRVPASLCGVTGFRPSTLRWSQAGIVPISHTRDTAGPMARDVADCVLLDGIVTAGAREVAPADLQGLRLGVPRSYFWENLDAEVGQILETVLVRLRDAGVVLVEGDVADVAALDAAAGFPIALYEVVTDLERYLVEHGTSLDFARLLAQVKSPAVKAALAGLLGPDAVSEDAYRDALGRHRPALQETYRRYFKEHGVAAMVFPTTPLPAAKIGEDDTVLLNGVPVPTFGSFIRNLCPGSAAGIPGLSLPAGMTKAGLPVGIALDGPQNSDHEVLAIGLALETLLPRLPAPAFDSPQLELSHIAGPIQMPDLKLTLACWDYDRTRPLIDGRVKPEGIDLDIEILRPRQAFQRMLDHQEFDVSELSLASYTALKGRGACPFVAVPVVLSKIFRHSCIYVRTGAGIERPQDLKGKRVGTSQWSSTGLVFMRGMLQHDYGVRSQDMHWFMGGLNSFVEPPLIPLNLPGDIRLDFLGPGQTLEQMFDAGELDALLSLYIPKSFLAGAPHVARLFPNFKEVEQDYYRRTGIFPIMHTVVVREDVHRAHPWVARSVYQAFCAARDLAVDGLYDTDALRLALPWLIDHVEEAWRVFGRDFWAYGLAPNRPTFEAIGRYVHEQGLSPRVVSADELFVMDLE